MNPQQHAHQHTQSSPSKLGSTVLSSTSGPKLEPSSKSQTRPDPNFSYSDLPEYVRTHKQEDEEELPQNLSDNPLWGTRQEDEGELHPHSNDNPLRGSGVHLDIQMQDEDELPQHLIDNPLWGTGVQLHLRMATDNDTGADNTTRNRNGSVQCTYDDINIGEANELTERLSLSSQRNPLWGANLREYEQPEVVRGRSNTALCTYDDIPDFNAEEDERLSLGMENPFVKYTHELPPVQEHTPIHTQTHTHTHTHTRTHTLARRASTDSDISADYEQWTNVFALEVARDVRVAGSMTEQEKVEKIHAIINEKREQDVGALLEAQMAGKLREYLQADLDAVFAGSNHQHDEPASRAPIPVHREISYSTLRPLKTLGRPYEHEARNGLQQEGYDSTILDLGVDSLQNPLLATAQDEDETETPKPRSWWSRVCCASECCKKEYDDGRDEYFRPANIFRNKHTYVPPTQRSSVASL